MLKELFQNNGLNIDNNILFNTKSNKIIGFINPGLSVAVIKNRIIYIGPFKSADSEISTSGIVKGLKSSGALIKGSKKDIQFIIDKLNDPKYSRTTSYLLNFVTDLSEIRFFFKTVKTVKVGILGCGGIGSNVAVLLAGLGFCNLQLIDNDKVEASNLNRQTIFKKSDIGKSKVLVLARELRMRFPDCHISKSQKFIATHELTQIIKEADCTIISADMPPNLFSFAQEIGHRYNKIIIAAGYNMGVGKIFMVKGKKIKLDNMTWHSPPINIASSSGPLNYEVSALACTILLKYYLGKLKEKTLRYEWNSLIIPRKKIDWI